MAISRSRHMLPELTTDNAAGYRFTNSIAPRQFSAANALRGLVSYRLHYRISQLRAMLAFAPRDALRMSAATMTVATRRAFWVRVMPMLATCSLTVLAYHVSGILSGGTKEKMCGVDADRVVAGMTNAQLSGITAMRNEKRDPGSGETFRADIEAGVAASGDTSLPFPAMINWINSIGLMESFNMLLSEQWYTTIHVRHALFSLIEKVCDMGGMLDASHPYNNIASMATQGGCN